MVRPRDGTKKKNVSISPLSLKIAQVKKGSCTQSHQIHQRIPVLLILYVKTQLLIVRRARVIIPINVPMILPS